MMKHYTAFIFDMDGTIFDSMPYHIASWETLFAEIGHPISRHEIEARNRGTIDQVIRAVLGDIPDDLVWQYARRKERIYRQMFGANLHLLDGLREFWKQAKAYGVRLALATNAGRRNVDFALDGLNIRSYFDLVLCGEDVTAGKPDPQIFLMAARLLNLSSQNCLVFEDSINGLEAASAAGMDIVAITTTLTPDVLASYPDVLFVIDDYHDPRLNALFARNNGEI